MGPDKEYLALLVSNIEECKSLINQLDELGYHFVDFDNNDITDEIRNKVTGYLGTGDPVLIGLSKSCRWKNLVWYKYYELVHLKHQSSFFLEYIYRTFDVRTWAAGDTLIIINGAIRILSQTSIQRNRNEEELKII